MQAGTASADTALARGFDAAGHQTVAADVTSSRFVDNLPVQSRRLEPGIRCDAKSAEREVNDRPFAISAAIGYRRVAFARLEHAKGKGCDPSSKNPSCSPF